MFVSHNNPNITYYKGTSSDPHAKCPGQSPECQDHWWIQSSKRKSGPGEHNEHVTAGPTNLTKLEFWFTGSTTVNISGECKSKRLGLLLNANGSAFRRLWDDTEIFAIADRLNASKLYKLTVAYEGDGILAIAGFGLDGNASVYNKTNIETPGPAGVGGNASTSYFAGMTYTSSSTNPVSEQAVRPSGVSSTGQRPSERLSADDSISRAALGGIVAGSVALIIAAIAMAWFIRQRIRARRAPSYAFRHGVAEAHWTKRPSSPAVPRSADWETYTLPTTDEVLRSPLLERTPSVSESSKVGIAM